MNCDREVLLKSSGKSYRDGHDSTNGCVLQEGWCSETKRLQKMKKTSRQLSIFKF